MTKPSGAVMEQVADEKGEREKRKEGRGKVYEKKREMKAMANAGCYYISYLFSIFSSQWLLLNDGDVRWSSVGAYGLVGIGSEVW